MRKPIVSVIIPSYNHGIYLSDSLNSVLTQTYTNWECIIVNDGSTDETEKISKIWLEKDNRFKYHYVNNSGVSNARNVGINHSIGEYILPLDGDDILSKNYIEEMLYNFNDETKVVYGELEKFGVVNEKCILSDYKFKDLIFSNMIHCSGMYKKVNFEEIQGYDINMREGYEDWEFWINLLKNGGNAKKVENARLYYRSKNESRMTKINLKKRYRLYAYVYFKHSKLYEDYTNNYEKKINLNFVYSFYLSAKMYDKSKVLELKKYYLFKLKSELEKYTFLEKKKILIHWFRKGKFNLSLFDVLSK